MSAKSIQSTKNTQNKKQLPEKRIYLFWDKNCGYIDDVYVIESDLLSNVDDEISGGNDTILEVAEYEFKRIRKFRAINKVEEVK